MNAKYLLSVLFLIIPGFVKNWKMLLLNQLKCFLGKKNSLRAFEFHRLINPRYSMRGLAQDKSLNRIRNIGLIAHVDAGKTTTSERMLYFSGFVSHFGNVDDGNTVMDFMEQERKRGITISSAAITFFWKDHQINLIDTPGHIDFSFEVERSLMVLDGAIVIIDASSGVEPQTKTVWNQSNKFEIPRIVFINKMDKNDANFESCLGSIADQLKTTPVPLQYPVRRDKAFCGVYDLVHFRKLTWSEHNLHQDAGKSFSIENISKEEKEFERLFELRLEALEKLSQVDETFAEIMLDRFNLDFERMNDNALFEKHLRHSCLNLTLTPVFCGSSFKNIAVQPFMDGIVKYLPHPDELEAKKFSQHFGSDLVAVCFKSIHDHQKSRKRIDRETESFSFFPSQNANSSSKLKIENIEDDMLTFVRVYNGELVSKSSVYNPNKQVVEKCQNVYIPYSSQLKTTSKITSGNIGIINGLSKTTTGDFLFSNKHVFETAKANARKNHNNSGLVTQAVSRMVISPPVYFCTVESQTESDDKLLKLALECLQRDDPSLSVRYDDQNNQGQIVLQGTGELQFEIVKNRLLQEYKLNAYFGPLNINYKEMPTTTREENYVLRKSQGEKNIAVDLSLLIQPKEDSSGFKSVQIQQESGLDDLLSAEVRQAINNGVNSAIRRGVLLKYPIVNLDVSLTRFVCNSNIHLPYVSNAAFVCTQNALKNADCVIIQPMMKVNIIAEPTYSSRVSSELTRRGCSNLTVFEKNRQIHMIAVVPLSKLSDFSSEFRKMTSGNGVLSIEFDSYEKLSQREYNELLNKKLLF